MLRRLTLESDISDKSLIRGRAEVFVPCNVQSWTVKKLNQFVQYLRVCIAFRWKLKALIKNAAKKGSHIVTLLVLLIKGMPTFAKILSHGKKDEYG